MTERILTLLQHLGMSPSRFADEIGVQRSAMSHLVSGRNNPSLEFITKTLKRFPGVNTEWLISGTGPMMRISPGPDPVIPFPEPEETAGEEVRDETTAGPEEEKPLPPPVRDEPAPVYEKPARPSAAPTGKAQRDKKAERVIIVYNDQTFRELFPEKD